MINERKMDKRNVSYNNDSLGAADIKKYNRECTDIGEKISEDNIKVKW